MYSNFKLSKFKLDGKNLRIVYISVKALPDRKQKKVNQLSSGYCKFFCI